MKRRFCVILIACYLILAAMNVGHYRMQRATSIDSQRYRITSIHLDGVTARGVGGRRSGEVITLNANPPLWSYVDNTGGMVILPTIVAQRVYTLQLPGEEAVQRTVLFNLRTEDEVIYSANLAQELFHWLIDQYHENRTFTTYSRNLFLSVVFIPFGLVFLLFPDIFRNWADSHMHSDYDAPLSRNRWFQLFGGLVVAIVFFFNALMFI
ncbi:MAG: hypothetical protein FWC71_07880 [Defluviitaleaceae bacterium]|nr:hypothetical protein [Defluviitaleaceae bacterium]